MQLEKFSYEEEKKTIELQTEIQAFGIGSCQMSFKEIVYEFIQKYKEMKIALERANDNINIMTEVQEETDNDPSPLQSLIQQATILYYCHTVFNL